MNREEQKTFVEELCKAISKDVIAKIESGSIPENWDGIELRQYVADGVAWHSMMDKRRRREYNNTIATTNL